MSTVISTMESHKVDFRSRASTPGLSCVSASSSAFSESGNNKNNENDADQPPLIDIDGYIT